MATDIKEIRRDWFVDQVALATISLVESDKISKDKTVSIKVIDKAYGIGINTAIDFFADQAGFINLLTLQAADDLDNSNHKRIWIRIGAKEFFKAADALRNAVVLNE